VTTTSSSSDGPTSLPVYDQGAARALVFGALRRRRRPLSGAIAGALLYMVVVLATPLVTKAMVDNVIVDDESQLLWPFVITLLVLGVLRAAGGALRKYQATNTPALIANDLRGDLFEHFQRLSFSYHDRVGAGQLMARASTDVTMLEQALGPIPWGVQSVCMFVLGVGLLVFVSPLLALVVGAVVAAGTLRALRQATTLYPASFTVQRLLGRFTEFVEQQVQGVRVVKGHGFERTFAARGRGLAGDVRNAGIDFSDRRAKFQALLYATPSAAVVCVIGLGGWLGATGRLTPGGFLAFMQYLALLVAPAAAGAELLTAWPQALAASARISEVLAADPDIAEPAHARRLPAGPGRIVFDDVTFGYRAGRAVLDGFSLEVPGGESVALVGASGTGKSTVSYLLCRFYDPSSGTVALDGVPVGELRLRDLRQAVSMVFEDTVIFTASIRENLLMGRLDAHEDDVMRAAMLAEADGFIRELPDGYDTVVGPQGYSLSGGQRQRLAIARAILRDSRVLVLDDAMSAVDPPTEAAIRRGLVHAMAGRTTLIVAHRVETISLADRVVLLSGGRVVADGTHDELLALPAYRHALAIDEASSRTGTAGS
jgi:ATP-binding cassette subfamily B protein